MMKINGHIAVGSIILGLYSGFLVKMISNTIPNEDEKLYKSLYCMIVFGVGEILAAFAVGKLIDYTNNRVGAVCSLISVILGFLSLIYTHSRNSHDIFWFLTAFLLGVGDSVTSTANSSICSFEFTTDDKKQGSIESFAIYNQIFGKTKLY